MFLFVPSPTFLFVLSPTFLFVLSPTFLFVLSPTFLFEIYSIEVTILSSSSVHQNLILFQSDEIVSVALRSETDYCLIPL